MLIVKDSVKKSFTATKRSIDEKLRLSLSEKLKYNRFVV
jgi:hypothetical protein